MHQVVLRNGRVFATHTYGQEIAHAYPPEEGYEIVVASSKGVYGGPDPRTEDEKRQAARPTALRMVGEDGKLFYLTVDRTGQLKVSPTSTETAR